jgi:hypothetical protein
VLALVLAVRTQQRDRRQPDRQRGTTVPRIEVLTEVRGRDAKPVLSEHVPAELLADEHFADQLIERLGWALADAEHEEQAIRQ